MLLSQGEIADAFRSTQSIITGSHVVYASGNHGRDYVNKDRVFMDRQKLILLCAEIAERFRHDTIDVVLGPAMGGVIVAQWVGYTLSQITGRDIVSAFADKNGHGGYEVRRGYQDIVPGKRVLMVEDVINTGQSIMNAMSAVRRVGGEIVALAALCNRGGMRVEELGVPRLEALVNVSLPQWPAERCPMCAEGMPINTTVGKGQEFLAKQQR